MKLAQKVFDFVFPKVCAGCGSYGVLVCSSCFNLLPKARLKCHRCYRPNPFGSYCHFCQSRYQPERILAAFQYTGLIKELIHSFKYEDETILADVAASAILDLICNSGLKLEKAVLVPIPISRTKRRFRGYNQTELIVQRISQMSTATFADLLFREEGSDAQVMMTSKKQRAQNVKGVFGLKKKAKVPEEIVLVDDVVTTGATAEEASAVLLRHGAKKVTVVALAMG